MKPEDSITQAIAVITPLVARGANIAQDVAGRVLGDVVAQRLHLDRHGEALEDFRGNAHNDSPLQPGSRRIDIGGAGDVQAGNRSNAISRSRVATRGGSYHQGDNITTNIINSGAGRIVMLAVIAIAVCGGLTMRGGETLLNSRGDGLDASSTCQSFPHFPYFPRFPQDSQSRPAGPGWHRHAEGPWRPWWPGLALGPVRMEFPAGHDRRCHP